MTAGIRFPRAPTARRTTTTSPSPRRRATLAAALAGLALTGAAGSLTAQHADVPPPAAYALEDVTVVRADGSVSEGVTIVVRDGLVEALGPEAEIPSDARTLEGDSLRVYPGLVDAEGAAEFEFPEPEGEDDEVPSWNPDRLRQGFAPHRRVVDALEGTGEDFSDARRAGIVASGVHPDDGLMPGRGVLILHRPDAEAPRGLVLQPVLGPVMSFEDAGFIYPGTLFGVIAYLRQSMEDARRHGRMLAAHDRDPRGQRPPPWDPDYEVLRRALDGSEPVYFRADGAEDIRRALELSEAYGFRPVIVGGDEAWKVSDRLRDAGVPVLVSVDFPAPTRWKPEEEEEEEPAGEAEEVPAGEAEPPAGEVEGRPPEEAEEPGAEEEEAVEAEEPGEQEQLEPQVLREKERFENLYSNAGRLAEADVFFALTSGGDGELGEGVRKAIEYGLPPEAALRALTATPAQLLGVPWLARIEPDLPATFVVADGDLFHEETRILYTFVEGRLEEAPTDAPEEPPAVDVTGTWAIEIETGGGTEGTAELRQKGASFSGTFTTGFGEADVKEGVVSGNEVSFVLLFEFGGESVRISMEGTVEGDEASGTGSGPPQMGGSFTWTATRESGPEGAGGRRIQ